MGPFTKATGGKLKGSAVVLPSAPPGSPLAFPPAMQIASKRGEDVGVPPRPPLLDCTLLLPNPSPY